MADPDPEAAQIHRINDKRMRRWGYRPSFTAAIFVDNEEGQRDAAVVCVVAILGLVLLAVYLTARWG